jgi:hypothetical protein
MQQKLQHITQKVKGTLLSYPMVLAMAVIMASDIIYMIENERQLPENFLPIRILITSALGISLMFAIKMLSQRVGRELLWHGLGLVFLVGYFFILPSTEKDFSEMYAFVLVPTFVLSHLLVAVIPFVRKEPEMHFWQYNKNLFINFFLTVIFTGVLTGGVELAIVAVDQLFSLHFKGDIYAETFFVLAIIGSVFIFLLFNEKGLEYLEKDGDYPVVLKFFTQFILIPLLLIYVVILYIYSGKILVKWELPEGWVSYLVLAYSIVGILALLLVHPLKGDSAKSWVKIFSKVFYYSLVPLIALLFTAIFTRLLQYGFTEARYYVLLLAVWLSCVALYFIFVKQPTIKFIPISLFLLGLFSLVFPYFNTFSVSIRSQKHELEQVLKANGLLKNNKIDFDKEIPADVAYDVSDKFEYLSRRFEYEYLASLMSEKTTKTFADTKTWYIGSLFTKKKEGTKGGRHSAHSENIQLVNGQMYHEVGGYQYIIQQNDFDESVKINGDSFILRNEMYSDPAVFMLKLESGAEKDFMPQIKALFKKHRGSDSEIKSDSLFVEGDLGKYHVKVVFDNISENIYDEQANYSLYGALFLIKEKK